MVNTLMGSCQLIVNADDLGWAPGRDRGIWRSVDDGIVTSVSLMANGLNFTSAVEGLRQRSVGLGVHLNLAEGASLTGVIDGVTDSSGAFLGKKKSRKMFAAGCFDAKAAARELSAQIEKVLATGLCPDHVDSHQHTFIFSPITEMILTLCRQYNIHAVRLPCPMEPACDDVFSPLSSELAQYRQQADRVRLLTQASGVWAPNGLYGMPLLNRLDECSLLQHLQQIPAGCWELMVHPGDEDPDHPFGGIERCREQQALTVPQTLQWIQQHNIQLTTFGAAHCTS